MYSFSLFLFILISVFWFFHIQQRMFYSLYFWQIKEYRIDRFLAEAKIKKSVIFSKISFLAIILFFLILIFSKLWQFQMYLIALFYFIVGIRSFYLLTARNCSFLLIPLILIFNEFILLILVFEILFPVFMFFCVEFIQIPVIFIKKQISRKAKKKRKLFKDLIVIGITGSYGKTSTKEFLYTILSQKYNVLKTKGNNNTEIGVANTVLQKLKKEHQIFICEMGAYRIGEIKAICEIVKPKIGILTGINEQHIALFRSQENIIKTKFELIESLPEHGTAILNSDNRYIKSKFENQDLKTQIANLKFCSVKDKLDIWAENIKIKKDRIIFKIFSKDKDSADFEVNLIGGQNIPNILLAVCCAKELGMKLNEISEICKTLKPMPHQMELKKGINNLNIIDSSYSANSKSVISHLDYLKIWEGKKVIIMPCLIELGTEAKKIHQQIGEKISEVCDLAIITTKEYFEEIRRCNKIDKNKKTEILFINNPDKIAEKIKNVCKKEQDIILLESRVPKELLKQRN